MICSQILNQHYRSPIKFSPSVLTSVQLVLVTDSHLFTASGMNNIYARILGERCEGSTTILLGMMCTAGIDLNVFPDLVSLSFVVTRAVTIKLSGFRVVLGF